MLEKTTPLTLPAPATCRAPQAAPIKTLVHHAPFQRILSLWDSSDRDVSSIRVRDLAWLKVFDEAFGHRTFLVEAREGHQIVGSLALAEVSSLLFGKYLVSLPYINSAGVRTVDPAVASALIDEAVELADELDVRYLELRHETELEHPQIQHSLTSKTLMQRALPTSSDLLWGQFKSKLKSQIRNGERNGFTIRWGQHELLKDFYRVFSHNMRDLGTPVFGQELFRSILEHFSEEAELCCVYLDTRPVAAALVLHDNGATEVPSASSLRDFSSTNANMVMYWHLMQRAIARGSRVFDFGRSTIDSNTYRFKKQWGAQPSPSIWQYYVRKGECNALRPESGKFSLAIRAWQRLPIAVTRWLGPKIVRGIP